jgi:hypothetical protein
MSKKIYRAGGLIAGKKFTIHKGKLKFEGVYGKRFTVPVSEIDTVTVDSGGLGKGVLKIIGHGTTLASIELPFPWAEKSQNWILKNISKEE